MYQLILLLSWLPRTSIHRPGISASHALISKKLNATSPPCITKSSLPISRWQALVIKVSTLVGRRVCACMAVCPKCVSDNTQRRIRGIMISPYRRQGHHTSDSCQTSEYISIFCRFLVLVGSSDTAIELQSSTEESAHDNTYVQISAALALEPAIAYPCDDIVQIPSSFGLENINLRIEFPANFLFYIRHG